MNNSKRKSTVVRLRLNPQSFDIVLEAIHILSARNKRFETFGSVISAGSQVNPMALPKALADLEAIKPFDGDIKVFPRLTSDKYKELEDFKALLDEGGVGTFGVRDALMVCTLLIAPRK